MDLTTILGVLIGALFGLAATIIGIIQIRLMQQEKRQKKLQQKEEKEKDPIPEEQFQFKSLEQYQKIIIESLIERRILATREEHNKEGGIIQLDDDYWTNFSIKFDILVHNDNFINEFAMFILRFYLGNDAKSFIAVDPDSFIDEKHHNDEESKTKEVVKRIAARIGLPLKTKTMIRDEDKIVLIAGIFSRSLKEFMREFSSNIHFVVILLAPNKSFFVERKIIRPSKVKVLISRDTLEKISEPKRKAMINGARIWV